MIITNFIPFVMVLRIIVAITDHDFLVKNDASYSAGYTFTCAVEQRSGVDGGGPIKCWGDGSAGLTTAPLGIHTQVSCGQFHCCSIKADETVGCWGRISEPFTEFHPVPSFVQISSGESHTCGLRKDGKIICWGRNDFDESSPPDGHFTQVRLPMKIYYVYLSVHTHEMIIHLIGHKWRLFFVWPTAQRKSCLLGFES